MKDVISGSYHVCLDVALFLKTIYNGPIFLFLLTIVTVSVLILELKKLRISRISTLKLNMPDPTSTTTTNTFLLVWRIAVLLYKIIYYGTTSNNQIVLSFKNLDILPFPIAFYYSIHSVLSWAPVMDSSSHLA